MIETVEFEIEEEKNISNRRRGCFHDPNSTNLSTIEAMGSKNTVETISKSLG
jgi:hypothetical protein